MKSTRIAPLPRRGFLLALAAAGGSLGLAGCGFELRKPPVFAFKSIGLSGNSALINQLRRDLRATGTLTVLSGDDAKNAEAVLEILGEDRDRFVISTDSNGQLKELQLRLRIRFRVMGQGKELQGASEVSQSRDLTYNETNALAKEAEADLLYRDMQSDIGSQMVRRLGAIKAP